MAVKVEHRGNHIEIHVLGRRSLRMETKDVPELMKQLTVVTAPACTHPLLMMIAYYDYTECGACHSIRTGIAGWNLAKDKWFESIDAARIYDKTGRLPDPV